MEAPADAGRPVAPVAWQLQFMRGGFGIMRVGLVSREGGLNHKLTTGTWMISGKLHAQDISWKMGHEVVFWPLQRRVLRDSSKAARMIANAAIELHNVLNLKA